VKQLELMSVLARMQNSHKSQMEDSVGFSLKAKHTT
jgi:hypothetical protein